MKNNKERFYKFIPKDDTSVKELAEIIASLDLRISYSINVPGMQKHFKKKGK